MSGADRHPDTGRIGDVKKKPRGGWKPRAPPRTRAGRRALASRPRTLRERGTVTSRAHAANAADRGEDLLREQGAVLDVQARHRRGRRRLDGTKLARAQTRLEIAKSRPAARNFVEQVEVGLARPLIFVGAGVPGAEDGVSTQRSRSRSAPISMAE